MTTRDTAPRMLGLVDVRERRIPPLVILGILVVAAPLLLLPNPAWVVGVLLVVPLLLQASLALLHSRCWIGARVADAAAFGLLAMGLVGTLIAAEREYSQPRLLGLLYAVTMYFAVRAYARTPERAGVVGALLTVGGLGVAILGIFGTEWLTAYGKTSVMYELYARIPHLIRVVPSSYGPMDGFHPNQVAGVLAVLVPVGVGTILSYRGRGTFAWRTEIVSVLAAAVLGMTGYILLSFSRAAWVSLAIAGVAMAAVGRLGRNAAYILLLIVIGAALALATAPALQPL
jgi:hypothetical protein